MAEIKKSKNKAWQEGVGRGTLTKSSKDGGCGKEAESAEKTWKKLKLVLDIADITQYNKTVPQAGRVPCKLNNERNEKHQTGALKSATKTWESGVQSITRGTKYKKFLKLWQIAL